MIHSFEMSASEVKSKISQNSSDIVFPSRIGECRKAQTDFPSAIGEKSEIKFFSSDVKNPADINEEEMKADTDKIKQKLNSPESIEEMMEHHPEKKEIWIQWIKDTNTVADSNASPFERMNAAEKLSAQAKGKMNHLQGQIFETALKDLLADKGLDVEEKQRLMEGENGGTRPDAIAQNNTNKPVTALGITVEPGQMISIECKCGSSSYINHQLHDHIPNQLSGQEGIRVLLTTSDINDVSKSLAEDVCNKYDAKLVIIDISAAKIKSAIMGVENL